MKKLFYTLGAALVMLASVSCEKKETVKEAQSSVEKADMTFKAVPAGTARTTVQSDGTTVVWSDGDAIKVFANGAESGDVCGMISGAGDTYAEFSGQCAAQGPWTAICPAYSETKLINGAIEFTMPDEQDYAENTFAQGAMPCVAYSETTEFTFNHSFGVLKLSLKLASGKTGSVKSIKVTTKGSEKLNGTFAVSPKTSAKATKSGADGTNVITLNCGSGVELGTTAKDFWIVAPAGAFASGFDVEITATDDKVATLSTDKNNTINVGEIKPMPEMEIEFKAPPTTGEAYADEVGGNVKWVQLWENGPKWAEYNVGSNATHDYNAYYTWGGSYKFYEEREWIDDHYKGEGSLSGDSDTATKLWGDNWRMPTGGELLALFENCDMSLWAYGSNVGALFTGRGEYSDNSVFFPAAGEFYGNFWAVGSKATYWSSTNSTPYEGTDYAYHLIAEQAGSALLEGRCDKCCSVRAVLNEGN